MVGTMGFWVYLVSAMLLSRWRSGCYVQAFAVHGCCGLWGLLAAALFHTSTAHTLHIRAYGVQVAFQVCLCGPPRRLCVPSWCPPPVGCLPPPPQGFALRGGVRSGKFQSGCRAVTGDVKRLAGGYWWLEMRLGLMWGYGNAFGVESGPECWGGGGGPPPPFKRLPAPPCAPLCTPGRLECGPRPGGSNPPPGISLRCTAPTGDRGSIWAYLSGTSGFTPTRSVCEGRCRSHLRPLRVPLGGGGGYVGHIPKALEKGYLERPGSAGLY